MFYPDSRVRCCSVSQSCLPVARINKISRHSIPHGQPGQHLVVHFLLSKRSLFPSLVKNLVPFHVISKTHKKAKFFYLNRISKSFSSISGGIWKPILQESRTSFNKPARRSSVLPESPWNPCVARVVGGGVEVSPGGPRGSECWGGAQTCSIFTKWGLLWVCARRGTVRGCIGTNTIY